MEPQANTNQYDKLPSEWPGAMQLYKYAKAATLVNWQTYLAIIAISFAASIIIGSIGGSDTSTPQYFVAQLVSLAVSAYLWVSTVLVELKNVERVKISVGEALSASSARFVGMLVLMLLLFGAISLSLLLLIIPFFFVVPRLILSPYYLVAEGLSPIDAMQASWRSTKGHVGKVYGITGVAILYLLLFVTIIGIPFAVYLLFMYSTAIALLYVWINKKA